MEFRLASGHQIENRSKIIKAIILNCFKIIAIASTNKTECRFIIFPAKKKN